MKPNIFILFVIGIFLPSPLFAQKSVDYRELGTNVAIIGQLGVPLGTIIQVDVVVVAGRSLRRSKDLDGEYLLKVTKVASNSVSNPPTCEFQTHSWAEVKLAPDEFSLYELKNGKKAGSLSESQIAELERGYVGHAYHLLVYEEGIYSGVPNDLPNDYPIWQDRPFGFHPHLIVLRIIEEPGNPNPLAGPSKK